MKNIYCLLGNSGCGKTHIADALHRNFRLTILKSYTTRPKRNESDDDHIYIDEEEYFALQNKVATRQAKDGYYCATEEQINESDIYVIDFGGLNELKSKYKGKKGIRSIYIDVDTETSIERMKLRGDSIETILYRIERDAEDNNEENILTADFVINGDDILTFDRVYQYIIEEEKVDGSI